MNNIERFRLKYPVEKDEAIVITSDINRVYLSGFRSSAGTLVLFWDASYLLLDFRYLEMALIKKSEGRLPTDLTILSIRTNGDATLKNLFDKHGIKRYRFEDRNLTFHGTMQLKERYPSLEQIPLGDAVENLRREKSPEELKKIKVAQSLTDQTFSHILNLLSPAMTERDVAIEIEYYMKKHGAENPAFETIVVSGKNSSLPHGKGQDVPLTRDGFITMDFGAMVDGYCSDMTRTVVLGKADEKMKNIYHTVLAAQNAAFPLIRAGVKGSDVDKAARDIIENAGYQGAFGHSLGHSLGMEIHESPNFSPAESALIPAGAVLSVEPGIYLNGFGGVRIEDIVFVREDGFENLTKSPKNLIEI